MFGFVLGAIIFFFTVVSVCLLEVLFIVVDFIFSLVLDS